MLQLAQTQGGPEVPQAVQWGCVGNELNESIAAINRSSRFWFTEAVASQQRLKRHFCNINFLNGEADSLLL